MKITLPSGHVETITQRQARALVAQINDAALSSHAGFIRQVIRTCASEFGVKVGAVLNGGRDYYTAAARHVAIAILMDCHGLSTGEAAKIFDRELSTADYAHKRLAGVFHFENAPLAPQAERILSKLRLEAPQRWRESKP